MEQIMKDKRVLVTGGSGFIGSNLLDSLVADGAIVGATLLDGNIREGVEVFRLNIQDFPDIERAIVRFRPDIVMHLAAQPIVTTALDGVYDTLDTNIRGTINLLEACRLHRGNISAVLVISTDKVYGEFLGSIDESAPLLGTGNPYDVSKVCTDVVAQMYAKVFDLPIVIARSGNIYGKGDNNLDRLIPYVIRRCLKQKPIKIRSNGKNTRDYIYVDDIISGYKLLVSSLISGKLQKGDAVNFGSPRHYSVMDVVHTIITCSNSVGVETEIMNTAVHEIPHQHLDYSWAKELGWEQKVSLEEGIKLCLDYYKAH